MNKMKKIDKEVLKDTASRLMFSMSEEEYDALLVDFEIITKELELISHVPHIDEVIPSDLPYELSISSLREDIPSSPLSIEEALRNAPNTLNNQVKLPKVVK